MSPLDDELRSLFHSRADALAPAPDPLGGIERRAKRMRRNRAAATIAGATLAVAAIAVGVPPVLSSRDSAPGITPATSGPSPAVSPSAEPTNGPAPAGALDPQHPWDYRGDKAVIASNELATLQAEWAAKHPGATVAPLYGEIYESSKRPQITFVSTGGGGDRWGVATSSDAGWTWLHDEELAAGTKVLMAALQADEVPRLLVVAPPATGQIEYAKDGSSFAPLTGVAADIPGVAYAPLQGDTSRDQVKVLDGNGDESNPFFVGAAPDATATPSAKPSNYLEWQPRGTVDRRLESQAVSAYAQAKGTVDSNVGHAVLWGGTDAAGRNLLFMEAWVSGGQAQTFGMVSTGERFLGPVLTRNPPVLAYVASAAPGQTTDTLVLMPRPGAGPFSYATSATAPYRTVGNARSDLQNVAMIDRDPKATSDKVQVLAGDGMQVLYDGPVQPLLCGASSCG